MIKILNLSMVGIVVITGFFLYTNNKETITSEVDVNTGVVEEKILSEQTSVSEDHKIADEMQLDVPLLNQMDSPRLYNGCEVTSLAMILNYKGISVTKNELAEEITRVPLQYSNGENGNPNTGFVGNMEDGPGLGVYHEPIFELAQKYLNAADLTNSSFDQLIEELANGNPVWVITTSTFAPISEFETWQTPEGTVDITYNMHSVVITGYDSTNIYINNPYGTKNQKVDRKNFIQAWEQMGKQAVVLY
ncbi:C39 family peptidase [Neobacillus sp. 3P2-tot-E-2]|uniref:C39 family peptidase n=1 Tax=Neobacillus sp. 3P2-tot-E-2 TaxID=3132212 RepID=UPI0039A0FEBC